METTKTLLTEELNIVNQNIVELFEKRISIEARIKSLEENMNHTDLENICHCFIKAHPQEQNREWIS